MIKAAIGTLDDDATNLDTHFNVHLLGERIENLDIKIWRGFSAIDDQLEHERHVREIMGVR